MHKQKGFTLLEILLVVSAIAILASIVILAVNPAKQLADTRNAERRADINTILNAVYQYTIDNDGILPASVPLSSNCSGLPTNEICKEGAVDCRGMVDLSVLTDQEKYIVSIPTDPLSEMGGGTGYHIVKSINGRVTICAPLAEQDALIEVTR